MERTCEHGCNPETCPPDGGYYVSAVDGGRSWFMAGPYPTHAAALAQVDRCLNIANERDGRAWFMGWGTVHVKDDYRKPGKLNELGLLKCPDCGGDCDTLLKALTEALHARNAS